MNKRKIIKNVFLWIFVLTILNLMDLLIEIRVPYKKAITLEEMSEYDKYIIVKEGRLSSARVWLKYSDENGDVNDIKEIMLENEEKLLMRKTLYNYKSEIFLLVDYMGTEIIDSFYQYQESGDPIYEAEKYEILEWRVVYPVRASGILPPFFHPQNYISVKDKYIFHFGDDI